MGGFLLGFQKVISREGKLVWKGSWGEQNKGTEFFLEKNKIWRVEREKREEKLGGA